MAGGFHLYTRGLPDLQGDGETLALIKACISSEKVRWTYHVTMRLQERRLTGDLLRRAVATLEIIANYPRDKYLPSLLLRGQVSEFVFHALVATDFEGDNIRVVTMYLPDRQQWDQSGRLRRT